MTHLAHWTTEGRGQCHSSNYPKNIGDLGISEASTLFFNAKFDIPILQKAGFRTQWPVIDVLPMAQMAKPDEKQKGLKHLSRKLLKEPYLEEIVLKKWLKQNPGKAYGHAPSHIIEPYNLADARRTLELFYFLSSWFDKHSQWHILEREMRLMPVILRMERRGIYINQQEVRKLQIAVVVEMRKLRDRIVELTGKADFNPNSNNQVITEIYDGTVMPRRFSKKTGKPQVSELALLEQPSAIGSLVVRYRKVNKARATYLKHFADIDDQGRLHASFNQMGARTGRFSSSGPNLQNIPRPESSFLGRLRRCIEAPPGPWRLLFLDLEQVELRLAAHFSGDPHMIRDIIAGLDLHGETCKRIFKKKPEDKDWDKYRYLAKTSRFTVQYFGGAAKLKDTILKETDGDIRLTEVQCGIYINSIKQAHPVLEAWYKTVFDEVAATGGVTNFYGRYMPVESFAPYKGVNYKIQGTVADYLKKKMLLIADFLREQKAKTQMIMQEHDELVFELHRDDKNLIWSLIQILEDKTSFEVPLSCSVSIGKNWLEKKKLQL